jgi:hypothetical protein
MVFAGGPAGHRDDVNPAGVVSIRLSGELVGLPYPAHCRILDKMFPDWKVDQLFQTHDDWN